MEWLLAPTLNHFFMFWLVINGCLLTNTDKLAVHWLPWGFLGPTLDGGSFTTTQGGLMTIICYTGSKFSNKTGRVHPPQIRQFSISKHVDIMLILHKLTLFAMYSTICFTISIAKPVLPCNRYILDTHQVILYNQSQPLPISTQMRSKRISDSHSAHIQQLSMILCYQAHRALHNASQSILQYYQSSLGQPKLSVWLCALAIDRQWQCWGVRLEVQGGAVVQGVVCRRWQASGRSRWQVSAAGHHNVFVHWWNRWW